MLLPSGSTELLALFGGALRSSPSPQTHTHWARSCGLNLIYVPLTCASDLDFLQLANALMNCPQFKGGNITNPFKTAALRLEGIELAQSAQVCGAGNTLHHNGQNWVLSNTDLAGCMQSIRTLLTPSPTSFEIITLGTGAMSRTVAVAFERVCSELKIELQQSRVVSRAELESGTFGPLDGHRVERSVVVNTLPASTQVEADARATHFLKALQSTRVAETFALFDLSYHETETLKHARDNGWTVETGRQLFHVQARESFKLWTNIDLPSDSGVQWPSSE